MPKKSSEKTRAQSKNVSFQLSAPEANTVALAGDFNGWDVNSLPLKKGKLGTWKTSIKLKPGRYEYRFWVNGEWWDDPHAQERVSNPFGGYNSIKVVS